MKKLLLLTTLVLTAIVSHGQTVTFANNAGAPIRNEFGTNTMATVALYGSTATGLGSDSTLTQIGATANTFAPGLFSAGARNIGTTEGATVTLQVRAWTGGFATYELAAIAGQTDLNIRFGRTAIWEQAVGGGTLPTPPITGVGRFTGATITPVPEPSSIALGLLGLGAIVLFRRRK